MPRTKLSPEEAKEHQRSNLKRYQAKNRELLRLKMAARRAANPERAKALASAQYIATKERRKELREIRHRANPKIRKTSHAKWAASHPGKMRSYWAKYAKRNPEKMREKRQRRYAIQKGSIIGDPKLIFRWEKAWRSKKLVACYWCRESFSPKKCHTDHIISIKRGGAHAIENLCISCQPCNSHKSAKSFEAWTASLAEPVLF